MNHGPALRNPAKTGKNGRKPDETALQQHLKAINSSCTCIGQIKKESGLSIIREDGSLLALEKTGFQHFMS